MQKIMRAMRGKQNANKEISLLEQFEAWQTGRGGVIGEFAKDVNVSLIYDCNFVTMHLQPFICILRDKTLSEWLLSLVFTKFLIFR
jgi:hypothetical protein